MDLLTTDFDGDPLGSWAVSTRGHPVRYERAPCNHLQRVIVGGMANPSDDQRAYRLTGIDMVRGLVIVIMALDHVRDFFFAGGMQDPTKDPAVGLPLFATRWITHFCAPVFVILAGTSAGLMRARKTATELCAFLLKRGLWLVAVEIFVISTGFTFAPLGLAAMNGKILVLMQVIWAIGASMIVLAFVQLLGRQVTFALGAIIVTCHNALDWFWPVTSSRDHGLPMWTALHSQMSLDVGPWHFVFAYPLLPWIGLMMVGFGAAQLFELHQKKRDEALRAIGVALTLVFLVLRAVDSYGDPNHWQRQPTGFISTVIDFLNTTKYPPSLLYACMTIGPAAILCSYADGLRGRTKDVLVTFGRVPFVFYVAHFYLIHGLSVLLGTVQGFGPRPFFAIFFLYPKGYGISLPGVYAVWAVVVAVLYPLCKWMAGVKSRRKDFWLSYL